MRAPFCPACWGTHGCDLPWRHEGPHQCLDPDDPDDPICKEWAQDDPGSFDVYPGGVEEPPPEWIEAVKPG